MVIEKRKRNQNLGSSVSKIDQKVKYNFDISMLGILCQYVLSENRSIKRGHLTNLRNVMNIMDEEVYQADPERKNMVQFIKKGLDIRLKNDIKDRRLILSHIKGGMEEVTSKDLDLYDELSDGELQYINDTVASILSTFEMEVHADKLSQLTAKYKAQDYRYRSEMTDEFKLAIADAHNAFRQIDARNNMDTVFSTDYTRIENDFSNIYDSLTNPNRFLRTQMQGFNQMIGGGLEATRFYLLLGSSGVGKSLTMLNMALQIRNEMKAEIKASDPTKKPTILFLTQENSVEETVDRMFTILTGKKMIDMPSKEDAYRLLRDEMEFSIDAGDIIIHILYRPDRSIDTSDLYNIIEDLEDDGYEVIALFQDHIKRIRSAYGIQDVRLELGSVVNEMKNLAIIKNIPVMSVSHLNRDANKIMDANISGNKYDLTRLLGRANVGESLLMIDNADAVFIIGKEFDVDNNEYLAINLIKIRYCEESLTYICYPFDKHNRIRIMTDTHLQVPIYKETMKPDTVLPQMTNGSLMNNTKPYKTISAMDSEENIFDILSDDAEIFSSSIDVLKDDIINSEVQFPVNIKEGNILDESKVIQLVTRA